MNTNTNLANKKRGLSPEFLNELEKGILSPILELVKQDITLCLAIRENYINIYYRGGNILRIENRDTYTAFFNRKYLEEDKTRVPSSLPKTLNSPQNVQKWLYSIPHLKNEMDLCFAAKPKNEREFQQVVVRENNIGKLARSTDYFICDLEYSSPEEGLSGVRKSKARFDLIAARWLSSRPERKRKENVGIAFIEMKYSDNALTGPYVYALIQYHLQVFRELEFFIKNSDFFDSVHGKLVK